MKLEQLRTFLAVLEHGSFSRAADGLKMSQSTVSFHVARLEAATEVRLLDRGQGTVRVTTQGAVLERYARRILAMSDEAVTRLHAADETPTGDLEIAASTMVAEHFLPANLGDYRKLYPRVKVTISVFDSHEALGRLRAQDCALALIGAPARDRRFDSVPFAHDDIVLVGPVRGLRKLNSISDLSDHPLILREPGSGTRRAVADLLVAANLERPDILQVGSTQAARRSVLCGLGYSFISSHAVSEDVRAKRLRVVKLDGTPVRRWFHAVRLRNQTPSPAAKALFDLLVGGTSAQSNRASTP